jgi:hypothetical protein
MIDKIWYTHTKEYFLETIRTEVMIHATAWVDFANMVCERSQMQKAVYFVIPLICSILNNQT